MDRSEPREASSRLRPAVRVLVTLALAIFGVFYLLLTQGSASIVGDCDNLVCGQLIQAVLAGLGTIALFLAAYKVLRGRPGAAKAVFLGTLPLFALHIVFVINDPNESIFFPLSTAPPPMIAGAILSLRGRRRSSDTRRI